MVWKNDSRARWAAQIFGAEEKYSNSWWEGSKSERSLKMEVAMEIGINNPGTRLLCCTYKNIQNNNPHEWGSKLKSEYIMIMYVVVDSYRKY